MTSKLTRDIIQSEIADFFAGVVEIHTELGGPNTVEEAQNQLTERVLACVPEVNSEPVAFTEEHEISNMHATGLYLRAWPADRARNAVEGYTIPLYRHAQPVAVDEIAEQAGISPATTDAYMQGYHDAEARNPAVDSEPAGYFRRYDPDFECLITQCDKDVQDSFPLYLRAQSEPIEANIARDAQRYRFLRDKDAFGDDDEPGLASWDELIELDMNEFDAAIDARMAHPSVDFFTLDNAIQKNERRRCKDRNCDKPIFGYSVDGLCEDCYTSISQQPAPVITFYRDGIEAAAKWIDQQREAYDSEHGWSDPDTGSFEFGSEIEREYSSTLEELAQGIRALHPNAGNSPAHSVLRPEQSSGSPAQDGNSPAQSPIDHGYRPECECLGCKATARICAELAGNSPVIPDGYVMVPKEPTERMVIDGFESEPDETFSEPEVWEAYQKMSGCEQAAFRARLCWAAMIAAAL